MRTLFSILAKNLAVEGWDFEDTLHGKPPSGHTPFEFVGQERTDDDLRRARELHWLAQARYQAHEAGDDEYRTLFAMAWKLFSDAQAGEIIPVLKHEDGHVRRDAEIHLDGSRTPEVGRAFEAIQPELPDYISEAVAVLRKADLDAHPVHRVWIRIDPGPFWIGPVNCRFETRANPDNWDWLVRWAKACASS